MPYITEKQRDYITPALLEVLRLIKALGHVQAWEGRKTPPSEPEKLAAAAGILNYAITSLAVGLTEKPSYARCALIRGVLHDADSEYYRRLVAPYEDKKAAENGDVYPTV